MRSALVLTALRLGLRAGLHLRPDATLAWACDPFCAPFPPSPHIAPMAGDPVRHDMAVDGHDIAAYHWRSREPTGYVLLAHGWSSDNRCFSAWIVALREAGWAVVAFDQPAHGRSAGSRADLPCFIRAIESVVDH